MRSLKRDIGPAAVPVHEDNRHADSPMSMTSPRTTLTRGHCAPLPDRSSVAPRSTLQQRRRPVLLRRDLRRWADYYVHTSLDKTGFRALPVRPTVHSESEELGMLGRERALELVHRPEVCELRRDPATDVPAAPRPWHVEARDQIVPKVLVDTGDVGVDGTVGY